MEESKFGHSFRASWNRPAVGFRSSSESLREMRWSRAITWSWAVVDDAILYHRLHPEDVSQLAKITHVGAAPLTAMVPFGEVQGGRLEITAPSLLLTLIENQDPEGLSRHFTQEFDFQKTRERKGNAARRPDVFSEARSTRP
ncbi:Uu.00g072480.m01.CDS01 [Anthostomella pinea]|uniref:Uu.00g072480.m01.CDS01 n=1 Tax=Anthostomella pinea TaxID=933095 RepID=A0AAI8VWA9_9PEZI|nr:Uu.00g072480.m01.CDS01 [Anthostomella pinea]